jgi:hypothetical protein
MGAPLALHGVTDGSNAAAGQIGEFLTTSTGSTTLPASTNLTLAGTTLSPGDWDVWGYATVDGAGTGATSLIVGLTTTVNGAPSVGGSAAQLTTPSIGATTLQVVMARVNITAAATYYISTNLAYTGGTSHVSGLLNARRVR